jgi:hypothetical protein
MEHKFETLMRLQSSLAHKESMKLHLQTPKHFPRDKGYTPPARKAHNFPDYMPCSLFAQKAVERYLQDTPYTHLFP